MADGAVIEIVVCWEDMLQACEEDDRVLRPKRKYIDQKLKSMTTLLKSLARYASHPPGSTQRPEAGMKYRHPRWHQTIRAVFNDFVTDTQAKIISLIDSSFVDEDQPNYVSTSDEGLATSSSNNEESGEDSSEDEGSASALDSFDFSGSQSGSKSSPVGKQGEQSVALMNAKATVAKQLSSQKRKASQVSKITPMKPAKRMKKQTRISKDLAEVRETFGRADLLEQQHMVKIRAFNKRGSTSKGDLITTIKVDVTLMTEPTAEERARETDQSWVDHLVDVFKTHASMFVAPLCCIVDGLRSPDDFDANKKDSYTYRVIGGNHSQNAFSRLVNGLGEEDESYNASKWR